MVHDLVMPKLGLTMTEGTLAEWRISPGQTFKAGDILAVVENDKAASDLEAVDDGVLVETIVPPGEVVPVGAPIARWSTNLAAAARRIRSTPLARRRALELGVPLVSVTGTGPRGRVKAADVETAAASSGPSQSGTVPAAVGASASGGPRAPAAAAGTGRPPIPPSAAASVSEPTQTASGDEPAAARQKRDATVNERIRPSAVQASMARRLSETKREVPHFYLASEAEVSDLLDLRARLNADTDRPHISMTHLLLAAVGRALLAMPEMDRVWADGEIAVLGGGDIGMAVDTPRGLVAPVLRGAAHMTLDRIADAATELTDRARAGRLTEADFRGGAVTVSNAGMHNVTYMTPIIAPNQSTILGVGSVRSVFRPDATGSPVLKRELGLVLAADHRLFDGVVALGFLNRIIAGLEQPLRLLRGG